MSRKRNAKKHGTKTIDQPGTEAATGPQSSRAAEIKTRFLAAIQLGVSVVEAARWVGISRRTLYRWRHSDPEFALAWDNPVKENPMVLSLEFEAFKRALNGNDRLLVFLLRSYHPDIFNERRRIELRDREAREESDAALMAKLEQLWQEEAEALRMPSSPSESRVRPLADI